MQDATVRLGRHTALDQVTLPVAAGTVTAVVGGDGAGKSTLVRCLTGRAPLASGQVHMPPVGRVGAVLHASGVYGDLSVDENLTFVADAFGVPAADRGPRTDRLLERAGLLEARGRLAARLSGGMRQKLAVICAMVPAPDAVVLDEPTTGVDPVSRAELWRLLATAAADGTAVVMTTTYLDEAERAGHVLVLDDGRTVLAGRPGEVVASVDGVLVASSRALDATSWRHGRAWRTWRRDVPDGASAVSPRLEDVVIGAQQRGAAMEVSA